MGEHGISVNYYEQNQVWLPSTVLTDKKIRPQDQHPFLRSYQIAVYDRAIVSEAPPAVSKKTQRITSPICQFREWDAVLNVFLAPAIKLTCVRWCLQSEALDTKLTVTDTMVNAAPLAKINDIKALLGRMMFSGKAMDKKVPPSHSCPLTRNAASCHKQCSRWKAHLG